MEGNRIQEAQEFCPFQREFGPMLPNGSQPDYPCPVWMTSGHDISVKTITLKSNNHLYATNTYILSNKLFFLFDESRLLFLGPEWFHLKLPSFMQKCTMYIQ